MSIRGNAPDELDELLIEYLATLDRYQAAQAELASDAKNVSNSPAYAARLLAVS